MNDTRGSIWRKWDLHIHSNASDGEMNPEQIILKAKELQLDVIALTDHHTAKNIDEFLRLGDDNGIAVIPGVEFRTEYGSRSVHIIGLFPRVYDRITVNTQAINELILNPLDISETKIIQKGKEKLIEDGNSNPSDVEAFKRGIFEVQVSFKEASEKIHKKLGGIVIVHAGDKSNSLEREMRHEGKVGITLYNSLGPVKEELMKENFIDICEITDADDNKDFYLEKFNKPSICSSDAHQLSQLGTKFTWIKADPTFEGLKQILFEPGCRTKIQEKSPENDTPKLRIEKFVIVNSNGFPIINQSVMFNRDLVSIIGGRGSGKSALLESLAYAFGEEKSIDITKKEGTTFISHFINEGANADFTVHYRDLDDVAEEPFTTSLKGIHVSCPYPILYLGQNEIERIAGDQNKLHTLVFTTILKNTPNADNILKTLDKITQLEIELIDNCSKLNSSRGILAKTDRDKLLKEIGSKKQELRLLESEKTKAILSELENKRDRKNNFDRGIELSEELINQIDIFNDSVSPVINELNGILDSLLSERAKFSINLSNDLSELNDIIDQLQKLNINLEYESALLKAKTELAGKSDISVEYIESIKSEFLGLKKRYKQYEEERKQFNRILEEQFNILNQTESLYKTYFEYYRNSVEEFLGLNVRILSKIKFTPQFYFDEQEFLNKLFEFADRRKAKNVQALRERINLNATNLPSYIKWLRDYLKEENIEENFSYFYEYPNVEIDKILFDNYLKLDTVVEYEIENGNYKSIDKLSLGQKGTVILKLYLSSGNNCPIVIDQPEDHLDNNFIYTDLVRTIRSAKEKRQIIIVTHNANLVVNGDSEQIIIANYNNENIDHNLSGSIENEAIREKIANILEGGYEAFEKREKKYSYKI